MDMSDVRAIRGAGGGKGGGGGGGISEAADTLSSVARARFVDLIGEGEIDGLVNNEFSIYLDGVPLKHLDGTPNYRPFRWDSRNGTQAQTVIPGFVGTQQESVVGLKLLKTQGRVVRSVPDAGADAVRVTVSVNGLTETTSEGRINGARVQYTISVRVVNGAWRVAHNGIIDGKTRARYQRSHEIPLTDLGPGPYEVGVERVTDDSASSLLVNDMYWDAYTIINYEQFSYPNSALVALEIDARYFSSVPTRAYHVRGLKVKVPTNYDPVQRTYATTGPGTTNGAWDGTFKVAYTNNPAWCYYDIVTTARYGLGKRITSAQISKWTMYTIGRYCDGLCPTGISSNVIEAAGGGQFGVDGRALSGVPTAESRYEPRFTLNCVINTKEDAYRVLGQLASVFRAMPYWSVGSVQLTQDSPTAPTMLYSNANVEGGMFNYGGSSRSQRHTVAMIGWNDPREDFKQKFEYIEDRAGIARYGVRSTEIVAFGCTSKSQARRVGLWLLYTERMETEAISFTVGMDSARVVPGNVAKIADAHRIGARWGGRILSSTVNDVVLDAPVTLTAGSYTLSVMAQDLTVTEKTVVIGADGSYSTLPVTVAFTTAPTAMAVWTLASTVVTPILGRVVGVKQKTDTTFEITCLQHDPSKYDAIELGEAPEALNYSFLTLDGLPAPLNLTAVENSYKPTVTSPVQSDISISWDASSSSLVRGYIVRVVSDREAVTLPEQTNPYVTISGVSPGSHSIMVTPVNHLGRAGSSPATATVNVTGIDTRAPADVSGFGGTVTVENGVVLTWNDIADYIDYFEIREGSVWDTATLVDRIKATSKRIGAVSAGTHNYLIKAVDTSGNPSTNAMPTSVVVSAAAAPVVSFALAGPDEVITWTVPVSPFGIDTYEIREGATVGASVFIDTTKAQGFRRKVTYVGGKMYWVCAIDRVGNKGAYGSVEVAIAGPGPVTSSRAEVVDNNALLYWGVPATGDLPVDRYEVRRGGTVAFDGQLVGSNGNSTFTPIFESSAATYTYWVAAFDSAGNRSTPIAITAVISQPPDYILRVDYTDDFLGTAVGMYVDEGMLCGPSLMETWERHFARSLLDAPNNFELWSLTNCTVSQDTDNDVAGFLTMDTVVRTAVGNHHLTKTYTTTSHANKQFRFSAELKAGTMTGDIVLRILDGASNQLAQITVTPTATPTRFSVSGTFGATPAANIICQIDPVNGTGTAGDTFKVGRAQLVEGAAVLPVWSTPDDQIIAGYTEYYQPSANGGSYSRTIDYFDGLPETAERTLGSTNVQVEHIAAQARGSVAVVVQISYKLTNAGAWILAPAGATSVLASNFRYVKVDVTYTADGGGNDLIEVSKLGIKLSAKQKTDSGNGSAVSTDVGGTTVLFHTDVAFVSVESITVTPGGTAARYALYDFAGGSNPTSFKVLLFDNNGNRVSGAFSWSARGY